MLKSDIAVITFYSIVTVYSIWRLLSCFFPIGVKDPKEFISCIILRFIFLFHFIFSFIIQQQELFSVFNSKENKVAASVNVMFADLAVFTLAKSVQDFAKLVKRQRSFIATFFWNFAIPCYLILCCFQSGIIYADSVDVTKSKFTFYATYNGLFMLFDFCLISIPFLALLIEIDSNDIGGEHHNSIVIGYIFIGVSSLFTVIVSSVSIWLFKNNASLMIKCIVREPVYLMLCFTQDLIDWIIASSRGDVDSDASKIESLTLGLVV